MAEYTEETHPFIIRMPDEPPTSEYGLGYEMFHGMQKFPKSIAQYVVETDEAQTYEELFKNCVKVAINLKAENLGDDDIVGLCVGNHKHACVPYVAGLFIGRKVTAIDPAVTAAEKAKLLQKVTPKILFVDENISDTIEEAVSLAGVDIKIVVIGENLLENRKMHTSFSDFLKADEEEIRQFQPVKLSSNKETAVIFFGSGTSGDTKGICISHLGLLTRTDGYGIPVSLIFAQLNWISYALLVFRALRTGTSRVLMNKFQIENVWSIIQKYKVIALFVSIFEVAELANSEVPEDVDISCLQVVISGGSALPPEVLLRMNEKYPKICLIQGYGLTEVSGPAIIFDMQTEKDRQFQRNKPNSCGTPIKGIWYKVVDPDTEEILGPNKSGELRLKSKLALVGYYNLDSSEAFDSHGWLKTGDIVYYDEDQCFFVVDRIKEMIKYRSWTVSATSLEHLLMTHPAVDKAAVIAVPSAEDSDYPMGIVTLKDNHCDADPKEIEKYVEERVLDRQRLRAGVRIVKELPLTSTGKIIKRILRSQILNERLK